MTIEEKRKAITEYCKLRAGCVSPDTCPLWNISEDDSWCDESTAPDEIIERNYAAIFETDNTQDDTQDNTDVIEHDAVNHPKHYCREGAIESIDEMVILFGVEAVKHFCLCNAWKYRYRANAKNGDEDLQKSDWYIRKYAELCQREL